MTLSVAQSPSAGGRGAAMPMGAGHAGMSGTGLQGPVLKIGHYPPARLPFRRRPGKLAYRGTWSAGQSRSALLPVLRLTSADTGG